MSVRIRWVCGVSSAIPITLLIDKKGWQMTYLNNDNFALHLRASFYHNNGSYDRFMKYLSENLMSEINKKRRKDDEKNDFKI